MGADRRQTSWPKAPASVPLLGNIPGLSMVGGIVEAKRQQAVWIRDPDGGRGIGHKRVKRSWPQRVAAV